ncbi:MAG: cation transporter [Rhodospirillaceae bacterium]
MDHCCETEHSFDGASAAYKHVLWIVIFLNAAMFLVETSAGVLAKSMALRADALDFLGDSVTYGISLYVIGASLRWRAMAALFKGLSLGIMGVWVFGATVYHTLVTGQPEPVTMGLIGALALAVNVASAFLLFRFRNGDANVRSVWLCSRNDAIGNVAVLVAAGLVQLTAMPWPDLVVAAGMSALFLKGAFAIVRHARADLARAAA